MESNSTVLNPSVFAAMKRSVSATPIKSLSWIRSAEVALDVTSVIIAVRSVMFLGHSVSLKPLPWVPEHPNASSILLACVTILLLERAGSYKASGCLLRIRETAGILQVGFLLASLFTVGLLFLHRADAIPFLMLGDCFLVFLLILQKTIFHAGLESLRRRGYGLRRVLIYGTGATGRMLYSALIRSPKLGLHPVAIIEGVGSVQATTVHRSGYRRDRPLVATLDKFDATLARQHSADIVMIATHPASREEEEFILEESAKAGVRVVYAADDSVWDPAELEYMELDGHVVYGVHQPPSQAFHGVISRLLDIGISAAVLLVAAIPMAVIALLVRMQSAGPVLFRQQRVGLNGNLFTILKFRTMHSALCQDGLSPTRKDDPRITKIGRLLRKTSLDELPQLLNILRGDMALVGPRPEMPFIVQQYTELQRRRLRVRPGLTGIWQLSADRCRPIHENIHYDLYYLKHRSVSVDIAVLLHTVLFAVHGT